jgi:transcription termination/antitermination protein NusA
MTLKDATGTLRALISTVSQEKNLDKAIIIEALEQAMLHAARKELGSNVDLEAVYNEELDEIELFSYRTVVTEINEEEEIEAQIILEKALEFDPETEEGDALGIKIESHRFGRIAAQAAKQIIIQKVRDAERAQIYDEFKDRVGEVISGYVRRFERSDIIVDLGKTEAILPVREQLSGEKFRLKDRIQGYVLDIRKSSRGPQIVLSRGAPGFLKKLFEQHVPEIYDSVVTIESAARDAGLRSKLAVHSKDASVDSVGACVGMKGARVQAVVQELNGEKIDIIPWDNDPARLVCNALSPAVVSKVIVDDENHAMEVIVAEDQLSLAIGRKGQNVRLAAQLTGWKLDIKSEAKLEEQLFAVKSVLSLVAGLGEMHAGILVHEGIKTPEELAEMSSRRLSRLLNLEQEEAEKILASAALKAGEIAEGVAPVVGEGFSSEDAVAEPEVENTVDTKLRAERIDLFMELKGVGEATATALADAGYGTVGDIIADSSEEVAQKALLTIGIARTVQIAADKYLQENQDSSGPSTEDV